MCTVDDEKGLDTPLRFSMPVDIAFCKQEAFLVGRAFFVIVLLSGLAIIGYQYDTLQVLGPWTCLIITTILVSLLWKVMKKHQRLFREICFDPVGLQRTDFKGNVEHYRWSELKDMVRLPRRPLLAACHFKGGSEILLSMDGQFLLPMDALEVVTETILRWTGMPDFFEHVPETSSTTTINKALIGITLLFLVWSSLDYFFFSNPFLDSLFSFSMLIVVAKAISDNLLRAWRRKRFIRRRFAR